MTVSQNDEEKNRMNARNAMTRWETPTFESLRMDAEVGSYQEDFEPAREGPAFARASEGEGTD
jgi:hypothetical protein